ncbi:MAG: Gfo/Idh/MocA family oxidoreductase, partial [Anaerolineae bacterium]|nr:Gfo/Idh/MocA family oxidoreductase [Anaerolineae bacterium]
MDKVRVGIIGSGFVANIHALGLQHAHNAEIVAVAGKTPGNAAEFAARHRIPAAYDDYRQLLDRADVDAITVAV